MIDIIQLIRDLLINKSAYSHQLEITMDNESFPFYEKLNY